MGYIYLLQANDTDYFKVGITTSSIEKRIKQLQTGSPVKITCIKYFYSEDFYRKIEGTIHRLWAHKKFIDENFLHLSGEWFKLNTEDVENFIILCFKIETNLKIIT